MTLDPIGEMLGPLLERLGLPEPDTVGRLNRQWAEIAGDPWSEQARPVGLRSGELVVEAMDAASASILRYRTGELLRRLDDHLGEGVVATVRVRVAKRPF